MPEETEAPHRGASTAHFPLWMHTAPWDTEVPLRRLERIAKGHAITFALTIAGCIGLTWRVARAHRH